MSIRILKPKQNNHKSTYRSSIRFSKRTKFRKVISFKKKSAHNRALFISLQFIYTVIKHIDNIAFHMPMPKKNWQKGSAISASIALINESGREFILNKEDKPFWEPIIDAHVAISN